MHLAVAIAGFLDYLLAAMFGIPLDSVDWGVVAVVVGAFLGAGTVKGVLGVGLPMIAVPVIASATGPAQAIALASVPIVVSNGWQAIHGGHHREFLRRFWPVLALIVVGTLIGVQILATVDERIVSALLGGVLVVFTTIQALPLRPAIGRRGERWIGPPLGLLAGVLGGVSGMFGPLLILFLVSLKLPKDLFVAAIALFFFSGSLPLFLGLVAHGILTPLQIGYSATAALPVILGLLVGRRLRRYVPQSTFEKFLYVVLILIGLDLIRAAFA